MRIIIIAMMAVGLWGQGRTSNMEVLGTVVHNPVFKTSANVITIYPTYCQWGEGYVGNTANATVTLTGTSGDSDLYVGCDSAGIRVGHNAATTATCNAQCVADVSARTNFLGLVPIAIVHFSGTTFGTITPITAIRGKQSVVAGSGGNISTALNGGTIEIDTSATPSFAGVTSIVPWKTGTSDPGSAPNGAALYRTDTKELKIGDGSAWNVKSGGGSSSTYYQYWGVGSVTPTAGAFFSNHPWAPQGSTGLSGPTSNGTSQTYPVSWNFSDNTGASSELWFTWTVPPNYTSQTVTLKLYTQPANGSVTNNNVAKFLIKVLCIAPNAAVNTAPTVTMADLNITNSAATGVPGLVIGTIASLDMQSCAANSWHRISFSRDSSNGADTWESALYLVGLSLSY